MKWACHYDLSLPLLEAIAWQESGWQQGVTSSAGAVGTGQIMPGTATFISGTLIGMPMNINSVSDNIRMSAAFLAYLAGVEGNNRCADHRRLLRGPLNLSQYGVFPETRPTWPAWRRSSPSSSRSAPSARSRRIFFWLG